MPVKMWTYNKLNDMAEIKRLSELKDGDVAIITKVQGHGAFRKRITEMGFVKGKSIKVVKNAPLLDPVEYKIMGYNVSLRRSEASLVEVHEIPETGFTEEASYDGTFENDETRVTSGIIKSTINIALVGNPNCGKTTLFNQLSGAHERVGNYGGVTIESKEATVIHKKNLLKISDLPGTYSITEYTPEELYVRRHIAESIPDVVINVIDASNLERNLFLTTQLIDMNIKVIIALNMFDELDKKGLTLDYLSLGNLIGIPVIPTVAVKKQGLEQLLDKVVDVFNDEDKTLRHIHINYGITIENSINSIQSEIRRNREITDRYSSRYLAIKLLENDKTTKEILKNCSNFDLITEINDYERTRLEKDFGESSETVITDARYGFIAGALKETCRQCQRVESKKKPDFDSILTHKFWGYPIFIFFMWLMFQTTFTIGSYPMEWIDMGVGLIGDFIGKTLNDGPFKDLLIDGVIGGVGGVIIFLPNILILFFFISFMEDTGYMARVAFIMDKLMHKIGLHGKSFIPLLMGFGCNVPAIMATRTLESRRDRLMTMLITPFMSCSARLPVYILIISAFFPKNQGLILCGIYLIGIIVAILVSLIFNKTIFSKQEVPFVMELPPYRMPTIKNTTIHMWFKGSQYLKKMGSVILLASVLIWALSYYPKGSEEITKYEHNIESIRNSTSTETIKQKQISDIKLKISSSHQENSYIGKIGHFIEPVIRPLGFDWKIGVSLITGLAAKEIVVSTMGILYQADNEADENSVLLKEKLANQKHTSGKLESQKVFTPIVAFGFMVFILLYFPCIAAVAAIKKEANRKWAIFSIIYTTGVAWLASFLIYQIGNLII